MLYNQIFTLYKL